MAKYLQLTSSIALPLNVTRSDELINAPADSFQPRGRIKMGEAADPILLVILRGSVRSYSPPSNKSILPGTNPDTLSVKSRGLA
jgi:hypothetical protein